MQNTVRFCFAALSLSVVVNAQTTRPLEFTVGTEYYNKAYRKYEGSERMMQQTGNLWSLTSGVEYRFNNRHATKVEGRYSRGKSNYIGSVIDAGDNAYSHGSVTLNGAPCRIYDIRALYEYTHPINDRFSVTAGAGLGHRVLRDLSSRADATGYDRKNQTTYAQINAGINIALPANFEVSPHIVYNHAPGGRQCSYHPGREATEVKQSGGRGAEVEVPVSKKFTNESEISITPFYRDWKIKKSDMAIVYLPQGVYGTTEPKNYTHETGVRVQHSF